MMEAIERGGGVAVWRQIERRLADEIVAGHWREEGRLPSEQWLAARFAVNRHTLRRAVEQLARRGLLRVEQGRGIFLNEHAIDYALGPRTRFSENLLRQGRHPGHDVVSIGETPAPPDVRQALKLRSGAAAIRYEIIGRADGRPLTSGVHWFPQQRLRGIAEKLAETRSITRALTELGVADYRRRSSRITARLPSEEEAQRLQMPRTQPVLVTESINVSGTGTPVEYGIAVFAADRVQLVVEPASL
jgi:GntR family transcriptional regulator, phosphonate transport system regulatory protein